MWKVMDLDLDLVHDFFSGKHEKNFYMMMMGVVWTAVFSRLLKMNANMNDEDDATAFWFNWFVYC